MSIIIQEIKVLIRLHQTLLLTAAVLLHHQVPHQAIRPRLQVPLLRQQLQHVSYSQYKNGIHVLDVVELDCAHIVKDKVKDGMVIVTRIVLSVMVICIAKNVTEERVIIRQFIDNASAL